MYPLQYLNILFSTANKALDDTSMTVDDTYELLLRPIQTVSTFASTCIQHFVEPKAGAF